MPISEPEWLSIRRFVEKIAAGVSGKRDDYFITGKVLKVNAANKTIYMQEFGDQPIPVVGFDYDVKYYDTTSTGAVTPKHATATVIMPKPGQVVLVAREMGTRRLPRCLGVIQGKNWIVAEDE